MAHETLTDLQAYPDPLTLEEVTAWLRLHPMTTYKLVRAGRLPGFKVGGKWRFPKRALERWVRKRLAATAPEVGNRRMRGDAA